MTQTRANFATLNAIRGICAMVVVTRHTGAYFRPLDFSHAYIAVDFFFVLSGFVIANAYGSRLASGLTWRQFMTIRTIRFYPLYFAGLVAGIASVLVKKYFNYDNYITDSNAILLQAAVVGLFMMPTIGSWSMFPLNGPSWSLFYELAINAVYGALHRWLTPSVMVVVIALAGPLLIVLILSNPGHNFNSGWALKELGVGVARVTFSFSVGIALHQLFERGHLRALRVSPMVSALLAWLVVAIVGVMLMSNPPENWTAAYELVSVMLVFPMLVALAIRVEPGRVGTRIATLLGDTSFAIYVLHEPLGLIFRAALQLTIGINVKSTAPYSGGVFILALLVIAYVLDKHYDIPVRAWLTGRLRGSKPPLPRYAGP